MKLSYVEVYLDHIRDLLDPSKSNLEVHESANKSRGVYVKGASEVYVGSTAETLSAIAMGRRNRVVAQTSMKDAQFKRIFFTRLFAFCTEMNADSSRSHSVLWLVITQTNTSSMSQRTGKLSIVDLAGSEKVLY